MKVIIIFRTNKANFLMGGINCLINSAGISLTKDPIPFSRLASKFLIEKIRDEFHKAQFKGVEL